MTVQSPCKAVYYDYISLCDTTHTPMTGGKREEGHSQPAELRVDDTAFWLGENEEENHDSTDKLTQLQTRRNSFSHTPKSAAKEAQSCQHRSIYRRSVCVCACVCHLLLASSVQEIRFMVSLTNNIYDIIC